MSKKSTTETGPSKFSQPYISSAANAAQSAFQGNQGNIQNISDLLKNNMTSVAASTLNDPGIAAAGNYNTDVLSGKYLAGNPNLQGIIDSTNSDVANRTNAAIGMRGGAGGSAQAQILARELAKNETGLRFQNYNTERGYQQSAVGNAATLSNSKDQGIAALLSYLTGQATIPQSGANSYASTVGGLMGPYTSTTQQNSFGMNLQNYLVAAAAAASKAAGG